MFHTHSYSGICFISVRPEDHYRWVRIKHDINGDQYQGYPDGIGWADDDAALDDAFLGSIKDESIQILNYVFYEGASVGVLLNLYQDESPGGSKALLGSNYTPNGFWEADNDDDIATYIAKEKAHASAAAKLLLQGQRHFNPKDFSGAYRGPEYVISSMLGDHKIRTYLRVSASGQIVTKIVQLGMGSVLDGVDGGSTPGRIATVMVCGQYQREVDAKK